MSTTILAINGSPCGRNSNTEKILQPFLSGAKEAGAVAETVYAVDLDIHDCTGCFSCWKKTPGKCIFDDDMPALLEKIRNADILVWATPLYFYGMTARLKRVMERTLPLVTPYMIKQGEHFGHPLRYQDHPQQTVLISNCGFIERYYFDALLKQFSILDKQERTLDNTILCTAGEMLAVPEARQQISWYLDAAYESGKEFVAAGKISTQTAATLSKDFVATETFVAMANASWNVPGETPPTLDEAIGRTSLPMTSNAAPCELLVPAAQLNTIRDVIAGMPLAFQQQAAGNLTATIAFYVTDAANEKYFLKIENGHCSAFAGEAESKPDIIIHTPAEVWLDVSSGKIDGQKAFMEGQYRVEGNIQILMMLGTLFKGADATVRPQPVGKIEVAAVPDGPIKINGMAWLGISFIPSTLFWILNGIGCNAILATALPLAVSLLIYGYRRKYIEVTWMDRCVLIFFAVAAVVAVVRPEVITSFGTVLGNFALAGAWLGTLVGSKPLTADYSKWNYPAPVVKTTLFTTINRCLTGLWGIIFLMQAALGLCTMASPHYRVAWIVVNYSLLIPACWFTQWFPNWYPTHFGRKL